MTGRVHFDDHQGRRILVTDLSGSQEWLVRQRA